MTILLDTNIVSEVLRPVHRATAEVLNWLNDLEGDDVRLCRISDAELRYGHYAHPDSGRRERLRQGWGRMRGEIVMLEFDTEAVDAAAQFRAMRKKAGRPVFFADAAIAGIALANDCALATRNTKDFEGSDLILINPFEPFPGGISP